MAQSGTKIEDESLAYQGLDDYMTVATEVSCKEWSPKFR